jgi:branched-chain amino acid transport system ATP-binding protein
MVEPLLAVEDLSVGYRGGVVIRDLSFELPAASSLAVLGRNGAGKSTLLMALAGHLRPRAGRILLRGVDITTISPHRRCQNGVGWVPQGREIFAPLTVDENLSIATRPGAWTIDRVYSLFPRLREQKRNYGDQLSGGEQQMLSIGRALMTNPCLLLLDEPLEGLAPIVAQDVAACIIEIAEGEGIAVILIEQHAGFALSLARHAIILDGGVAVRRGMSAAIAADAEALEQHLTTEHLNRN